MHDDAIVQLKGRFDKSERGDQILVNEVVSLIFKNDADPVVGKEKPPIIEVHLNENEFSRTACDSLIRIIKDYPGVDRFKIILNTNSGKKLETYLPVLINAADAGLKSKLNDLFGRQVA